MPLPILTHAPVALRPLPPQVEALLEELTAPPRLVAHLALVHDAAWQICDRVRAAWPALPLDREAVLIGAATHDIGKTVHREELIGSGTRHEEVGEGILLTRGFPPHHARFARSHGGPAREPNLTLEDWLVMLADSAWKGSRRPVVEEGLLAALAEATGAEPWEIYVALDDLIARVAAGADTRLAWHSAQPA